MILLLSVFFRVASCFVYYHTSSPSPDGVTAVCATQTTTPRDRPQLGSSILMAMIALHIIAAAAVCVVVVFVDSKARGKLLRTSSLKESNVLLLYVYKRAI